MNNNLKLEENNKLKRKALMLLSKAIAKILLKFRLPRNELINAIDEKLVLEAKNQDPDASNVSLAIRTGIDRRSISKHLNGEMPRTKPDKLTIILEDMRWTAHKYYNSKSLPKTGPFKTFQSICELRASGTLTYTAILEELIKNGNVKDLGDKVELLELRNTVLESNINYSQLTATQINRVVDTIIYNSDIESINDKYVQRTIFTTQINPNKFNQLHIDFRSKTEEFRNEINSLFIEYEEDVNVGTYPEYGFSFLEYTIEK